MTYTPMTTGYAPITLQPSVAHRQHRRNNSNGLGQCTSGIQKSPRGTAIKECRTVSKVFAMK